MPPISILAPCLCLSQKNLNLAELWVLGRRWRQELNDKTLLRLKLKVISVLQFFRSLVVWILVEQKSWILYFPFGPFPRLVRSSVIPAALGSRQWLQLPGSTQPPPVHCATDLEGSVVLSAFQISIFSTYQRFIGGSSIISWRACI